MGGGVQMHSPLVASRLYFCVHNCTSPSNDYAATTNRHSYTLKYQFFTDLQMLGLELLRDIQFGLPAILNNSLASYQSVAMYIGMHSHDQKMFGCASYSSD